MHCSLAGSDYGGGLRPVPVHGFIGRQAAERALKCSSGQSCKMSPIYPCRNIAAWGKNWAKSAFLERFVQLMQAFRVKTSLTCQYYHFILVSFVR